MGEKKLVMSPCVIISSVPVGSGVLSHITLHRENARVRTHLSHLQGWHTCRTASLVVGYGGCNSQTPWESLSPPTHNRALCAGDDNTLPSHLFSIERNSGNSDVCISTYLSFTTQHLILVTALTVADRRRWNTIDPSPTLLPGWRAPHKKHHHSITQRESGILHTPLVPLTQFFPSFLTFLRTRTSTEPSVKVSDTSASP